LGTELSLYNNSSMKGVSDFALFDDDDDDDGLFREMATRRRDTTGRCSCRIATLTTTCLAPSPPPRHANDNNPPALTLATTKTKDGREVLDGYVLISDEDVAGDMMKRFPKRWNWRHRNRVCWLSRSRTRLLTATTSWSSR
jgi:hypothetical protein